ncbi:ISL3 family transposase [Streptomyces sp. NPDC005828]|uniref:ISL3 family transposase n=1 Tax=Streptomyces sp. NPDC005828 TaxID=3157071 RepID=UPI0033FFAB63
MFSGLSPLAVEGVADDGDTVVITARTRGMAVPCPVCGMPTAKVHGYHGRTVADVPVGGRRVVVRVRIRRLARPVLGCSRQTFREQIPGLLKHHQRRTVRLAGHISEVSRELRGRAASRLAGVLAVPVSRSTALRHLRSLPLPQPAVPRVIGVDDFALRRRHRYATIITDATTGRRVAVLPGREAATLETWLREHPGAEVVCRDGSATYAEAVRRALPDAVQVSDRWHLWRNLCDKVQLEVRAHAGCWATIDPPRPGGVREQTTRERWNKIHDLLGQGVGLLDCPRRLGLAMNTVKRYARMPEPQALRIAPVYRPTLADLVRGFTALLKPAEGNDVKLTEWITAARAVDLPHLRSLTNGLEIDRPAVDAGLTLPYHNGRTEGVNTRTKRIMRQMHGRAGFDLLRHRILLP